MQLSIRYRHLSEPKNRTKTDLEIHIQFESRSNKKYLLDIFLDPRISAPPKSYFRPNRLPKVPNFCVY